MKYDLSIRKHNEKAHIDIENDIGKIKNGVFTFVLRLNNGNIVDYNVVEYVDVNKYAGIEQIIIEEFTLAYHYSAGGGGNAIRTDNLQRGSKGGSSASEIPEHSEE